MQHSMKISRNGTSYNAVFRMGWDEVEEAPTGHLEYAVNRYGTEVQRAQLHHLWGSAVVRDLERAAERDVNDWSDALRSDARAARAEERGEMREMMGW